jgi:hypothetical protein
MTEPTRPEPRDPTGIYTIKYSFKLDLLGPVAEVAAVIVKAHELGLDTEMTSFADGQAQLTVKAVREPFEQATAQDALRRLNEFLACDR